MRLPPSAWCALVTLLGSSALATGCSTEPANGEECLPGDYQVVTRADGTKEYYQCGAEGGAYTPNDGSDPNALPDANKPDTGPCGADGKLGFMCPGCTTDNDCEPGLNLVCFSFPNKGGNICTPPCNSSNASAICVAPSAGCGNNGHCKP